MKTLSTYKVNPPTTSSGHSISVTTTIFGTEEEVEYIRKSCEECIGSGLVQEYDSPLTSQFSGFNHGRVVPDVRDGWRCEEKPQGEWIKIFENPYCNGYACPFCGHKIQVTEQFLSKVTECEVCGADMRGEK